MTYEVEFPVRYYEADPMGVVHHSEYVRYFECARNAWLHEIGYLHKDSLEDGIVIPVVDLSIRYRHSARFGDVVKVTAEVRSFDRATLAMHQQVIDGEGVVCAEGDVTLAFLSTRLGRPVRCPERLTELINNQLNQ